MTDPDFTIDSTNAPSGLMSVFIPDRTFGIATGYSHYILAEDIALAASEDGAAVMVRNEQFSIHYSVN